MNNPREFMNSLMPYLEEQGVVVVKEIRYGDLAKQYPKASLFTKCIFKLEGRPVNDDEMIPVTTADLVNFFEIENATTRSEVEMIILKLLYNLRESYIRAFERLWGFEEGSEESITVRSSIENTIETQMKALLDEAVHELFPRVN